MNSMRTPTVNVSAPSNNGPITLNPMQVQQIIRGVSNIVTLDGRAISQSVNNGYVTSGNRGTW